MVILWSLSFQNIFREVVISVSLRSDQLRGSVCGDGKQHSINNTVRYEAETPHYVTLKPVLPSPFLYCFSICVPRDVQAREATRVALLSATGKPSLPGRQSCLHPVAGLPIMLTHSFHGCTQSLKEYSRIVSASY
jgi:hypothetical protein